MRPTWLRLPLLATAILFAPGAHTATAVVQARPAGVAGPHVTVRVQGDPTRPLGRVGLLPIGDAPRAPNTGRAVAQALQSALAERETPVIAVVPPSDAAENPASSVSLPLLLRKAREAGAAVVITGQVTQLDVELQTRGRVWVRQPGIVVEVPPDNRVRTRLAASLRLLSVASGGVICSAEVRHDAIDVAPDQVLVEAMGAALDRCTRGRP